MIRKMATWERSAKREETNWLVGRGNERKKEKLGVQKTHKHEKNATLLFEKQHLPVKTIYYVLKILLLSVSFYILGTIASFFSPSIPFFKITNPAINFLFKIDKSTWKNTLFTSHALRWKNPLRSKPLH